MAVGFLDFFRILRLYLSVFPSALVNRLDMVASSVSERRRSQLPMGFPYSTSFQEAWLYALWKNHPVQMLRASATEQSLLSIAYDGIFD